MEYLYHQVYQKEIKYDEQALTGIKPKNPSLVFLFEALIAYMRELAIYILKLKKLGITNEKIKEDFLNFVSGMATNFEYSQEQFFEIVTKAYFDLLQTKEFYISTCKKNHFKVENIRSILKDPRQLNFSDLIRLGQQLFMLKYKLFTPEEWVSYELLMNIGVNLYVYLVELRELGFDDENSYDTILALFGMKNSHAIFVKKLPGNIKKFLDANNRLLRKLHEARKERYGEIEPAEVSASTRPNKAILVAGSNLRELELLLEATKDKGVDIYTNGQMISAHTYPKFRTYPHLIGHFGGELENYLLDFAEFPGAVFLTRHSFLSVENFYRGRIYTADLMAPQGIVTVKNNNFEKLIESTLHAEGFTETINLPSIKLTFSEKQFFEKITDIAQKIEDGKIKYLLVIGTSNHTKEQKEYFDKFLNLLGDDCFVLSFSYFNREENVFYADFENSFPLIYKALNILTGKTSIKKLNPIILFTNCGKNSLSNMAYMKQIGINKIYFADCSPNLFNPAFIGLIKIMYDLKNFTTPENDLKNMLS